MQLRPWSRKLDLLGACRQREVASEGADGRCDLEAALPFIRPTGSSDLGSPRHGSAVVNPQMKGFDSFLPLLDLILVG